MEYILYHEVFILTPLGFSLQAIDVSSCQVCHSTNEMQRGPSLWFEYVTSLDN